MRTQDLRDSSTKRQRSFFHKRGWGKWFKWEAYFSKTREYWFAFEFTLGGEDSKAIKLHLAFLWFQLFLTFPKVLPERYEIGWFERNGVRNPLWFEESHGRSWGVSFYENHLTFNWGHTVAASGKDRKKYGYYKFWFVDEVILGRREYTQTNVVEHKNVPIYFPEGVYHLNITLSEDVWTYKRFPHWPFKLVVPRAHIDVVEQSGIRAPGKGENSWDCGDNNTMGLICLASNLHEAVEAMRSTVNETRRKYGSGEAMYATN